MRIELTGTDTATYGDISVSSRVGPICKLARKMIEAGMSGDSVIGIYRDGVKCFNDTPLSWWAERTTVENDRQSIRFAPYVPFSPLT